MNDAVHSVNSSLREQVIEHLFIGELLRCLWCRDTHDIEVLRGEVDLAGYDVVVEVDGVMRHIQLKASHHAAKRGHVDINIGLGGKPSGCIVWIFFDQDSLSLGPFLWFGGKPGEALPPLGDRVAKHTKANSEGVKTERPNIRLLAKGRFLKLETVEEVTEALFGV